MSKEDYAMFNDALPVNALPFLNRMVEILEGNKTNTPAGLSESEKDKFRANLWIVLYQTHGQLFKLDHYDEYKYLDEKLNK
jgi:hypothetical protein